MAVHTVAQGYPLMLVRIPTDAAGDTQDSLAAQYWADAVKWDQVERRWVIAWLVGDDGSMVAFTPRGMVSGVDIGTRWILQHPEPIR